jgi:peptidoglycan/xylan/chitin deacetylase (PgdA/CDA1 family)
MGISRRLAALHYPRSLEALRLRRAAGRQGVVLMYHEVLPDHVDLPVWTVLAESKFIRQMRHLQQNYEVISLAEALERVAAPENSSRPDRPFAVVTFDDGYQGNLSCVLPVMESLRLPFTVFVATDKVASGGLHWYDKVILHLLSASAARQVLDSSKGPIHFAPARLGEARRWARIDAVLRQFKQLPGDEREALASSLPGSPEPAPLRMLTRAELHQLAQSPLVDIGCHTHGHELLDQLPRAAAEASIRQANRVLEECTGRTPRHFSYPNGNHDAATMQLVADLGFSCAVTTVGRPWVPDDDRFAIPRIGVGRFDTMNLFRAKLAGQLVQGSRSPR